MEVRGRLMNVKLSNIHCLITEKQSQQRHVFLLRYLLNNGLSPGDSFQLFIIFNYSILTAMLHKEDTFLLFKHVSDQAILYGMYRWYGRCRKSLSKM